MKTAVLFLIFNRPELTKRVFSEIRKAKPSRLYIGSDGPRADRGTEIDLVHKTRNFVLSGIDWDCEIKTIFRDKNLGCRNAVSSAIDWFFDNEEMGIILEDDCLPDQSFFPFCEELLEKYKDDEKIMHISGNNFQNGIKRGEGSYYFSQLPHSWGWATWKRAWELYDISLVKLENVGKEGLENIFMNNRDKRMWTDKIWKSFKGETNSWATLWCFSNILNKGLSIIPNINLVENIGFGNDSTHTKRALVNNPLRQKMCMPLVHPKEVCRNEKADDYTYKTVYSFATKIKNFVARLSPIQAITKYRKR